MKKMKFKCKLLTDIVLSQTSSSEGNQQTLDFIPGNNFLGIVAQKIYALLPSEDSGDIFHSSKVRFGDAHPSAGVIRGLKVPASMYYPKMQKASEACYIHHLIENEDEVQELQLKQCREGFYIFDDDKKKGLPVSYMKNFALKSAYDSDTRRSKESCMFGYESLPSSMEMYFEVESDLSDELNLRIEETLIGIHRLGRSHSAQYGLVEISAFDFAEPTSVKSNSGELVSVYADGRLIFLDDNGCPTFQPKPAAFGPEVEEILWAKCQIRTFNYSPWNGKRHTYDNDRCGIEKGSVFVVRCSSFPKQSKYVGSYNNEGFGKVIFNPAFLTSMPNTNGKAAYRLEEKQDKKPLENKIEGKIIANHPLFVYLETNVSKSKTKSTIHKTVQSFVNDNSNDFKNERFSSQWGAIRSFAMIESDPQELKAIIKQYIEHGVAKEKWEEFGRKKKLLDFLDKHLSDDLQSYIIQLSSIMAKKCKNNQEE